MNFSNNVSEHQGLVDKNLKKLNSNPASFTKLTSDSQVFK